MRHSGPLPPSTAEVRKIALQEANRGLMRLKRRNDRLRRENDELAMLLGRNERALTELTRELRELHTARNGDRVDLIRWNEVPLR